MKKFVAFLLLVSLLCMSVAMAEPSAVVKSSQEFIVDKGDGKYTVYFFAEVENTGDEPFSCSEVLVDLTDGDGNIYQTSKANSVIPSNVQVGGFGFTWRQESLKDVADAALISDYNVTVTPKKGAVDTLYFPVEYTLVTEEKEDRIRTSVEFLITNDIEDICMWPSVSFGIYDQNDQIMYASYVQAADAGLIPGNQLLLLANVSDEITRAWFEKGLVPTTVKCVCRCSRKK